MVRALLATALLATAVAAAPSRWLANNHGYKETFEPCTHAEYQKTTWFDHNGVEYGWDEKAHKACLAVKDHYKPSHETYHEPKHETYHEPKHETYYEPKHESSYHGARRPYHNKYHYFAAPSYNSHAEVKCEEKYTDKTYTECSETYEYAKTNYCGQHGGSGTKHGECITEVSQVNDQCVKAIDHHKPYCWDKKYLPEGGYYKTPKEPEYKEPEYKEPEYKEPEYKEPEYKEPEYKEPEYKEPEYKEPEYKEPAYEPEYKEPVYEPEYKEPAYEHEYKEPVYEPEYNEYETEYKEPTYEEPEYKAKSLYRTRYATHEKTSHGGNTDCSSAKHYFESTKSPTLTQCVSIACAPGQGKHYIERALYQCYALEQQAKATNNGRLPHGW